MARKAKTNKVENVVENVVVENVVVESEEIKMENTVVENVVVNDVIVAESEENAMQENVNEVNEVNEVTTPAADVDENEENENEDENKKERKERAKINTTPFPVREIVRDRLACLLPAVVASMGEIENAQELASAKLYSLGHDIIIDLVNALQVKFEEYAPRAYKGKNPSNHWLLWENTRNASLDIKQDLERELIKLYTVTDEKVNALIDSTDYYVSRNARYSIDNFLQHYVIFYDGNISTQVKEIVDAGIDTVYVRFMSPELMNLLMVNGFMCVGIEDIDAREYAGISKKYPAIKGMYKFKKMQ